jgi:hypothetical protein
MGGVGLEKRERMVMDGGIRKGGARVLILYKAENWSATVSQLPWPTPFLGFFFSSLALDELVF